MDFDCDLKQSGTPLKVDIILERLDDTEAEQLREALNNPATYSARHVARTVTKQTDETLSGNAVTTWRERNL